MKVLIETKKCILNQLSVISYQLSVSQAYGGGFRPATNAFCALGGGRATTRI